MTELQDLIHRQVAASVVSTVSRATDKIAEEMAREILKDPAFRQELQTLIRSAFTATVGQLATEIKPDPTSGGKQEP
jgi:hypothetical protein